MDNGQLRCRQRRLFQSFFEEKYHNCQLSIVNCQFRTQCGKQKFTRQAKKKDTHGGVLLFYFIVTKPVKASTVQVLSPADMVYTPLSGISLPETSSGSTSRK